MTDTHPYSLRQLEQMLNLPRRVITGLIAAGFVTPQRGARNAYRFSFQDVVLLRTAHQLREAKIPPRRLLLSLKQLKAKLPDQMPLSGLRIKVIGNDVAVRDADAIWEDPSGQLVMDFELAPPEATRVHTGGWSSAEAPSAATPNPVKPTSSRTDGPSSVGGADIAELYDRALQLEADRDLAGAAHAYLQVLDAAPSHADAAVNLSALLCDTGKCEQALDICDRSLAAGNETVALLHFNRAIALEDLGKRDPEARHAYERALQLAPSLADAHYNLARLHEKIGHKQAALRHFSAYRRLQQR